MKTQQELDRWIDACQTYYNLNSKSNSMKTNEERIQQLEQAHSRLFNQFNTLHQDFIQHRMVYQEQIDLLKQEITSLQNKEEPAVKELPENLYAGTEYVGVISEVVKKTPTKWKDMEYCNWQLKLQGKEEHYIAFIPLSIELVAGDKVRFTYAHPFQLRKLKQI